MPSESCMCWEEKRKWFICKQPGTKQTMQIFLKCKAICSTRGTACLHFEMSTPQGTLCMSWVKGLFAEVIGKEASKVSHFSAYQGCSCQRPLLKQTGNRTPCYFSPPSLIFICESPGNCLKFLGFTK